MYLKCRCKTILTTPIAFLFLMHQTLFEKFMGLFQLWTGCDTLIIDSGSSMDMYPNRSLWFYLCTEVYVMSYPIFTSLAKVVGTFTSTLAVIPLDMFMWIVPFIIFICNQHSINGITRYAYFNSGLRKIRAISGIYNSFSSLE